jgi:hypothetical protein
MRTDIHTTVTSHVLGKARGRFVTVGTDDLRTYRSLRLRLNPRRQLQAIANPGTERRSRWLKPAGAIRMPRQSCSDMRRAGSSCLHPSRPCAPRSAGNLG